MDVATTITINGHDSPTKSNRIPPIGYPIKTPVAIAPMTRPMILVTSSSHVFHES